MAKCNWCGVEVPHGEKLCKKCKENVKLQKNKSLNSKLKHCNICGTEYEGDICPGCEELKKKNRIKDIIRYVIAAIICIFGIIVFIDIIKTPTEPRCSFCTEKPEYKVGRYDLCEKHYIESLARTIID